MRFKIREVLEHEVGRLGQVPRSSDLDARDELSLVDRALKRDSELVGRAGNAVEVDLLREAPHRSRSQVAGSRVEDAEHFSVVGADRGTAPRTDVCDRARRARRGELVAEVLEVAP